MKNVFSYILFAIVMTQTAAAQDVFPTKGKEFWMGFMRNYLVNADQSLDLFITSDVNTTGTVEMPLLGWSEAFSVTANVTTTVTVPNSLAETFASEVIDDRGIFISTEDTVSVFAVNFKPISADGSKVLPIQSLGTDYMITSYQGVQNFGSQFMIVATEDDTEIEIIPTALTYGGVLPGESIIINLDQGQTYQVFADLDDNGDFMGTIVRGTENSGTCRPFAVFSGASCADIPTTCDYCDHIFDQNLTRETWGTDYYIPPLEFASGGYTYRIMASEDNTVVNINSLPPLTLNQGEYVEFNDQIISQCISASSPINVTQYFQGIFCAGDGDPSMLILNDVSQVIDNVTFSTMQSDIITTHGLNIISETAFINDVTLDGTPVDPSEFIAFPSCPDYSYAQLTIPEGSHTLDSPNGLTAYVFGVGPDESYAYSVGSFIVEQDILEQVDSLICSTEYVLVNASSVLSDVNWWLEPDDSTYIQSGSELFLEVPFETGIYVSEGTDLLSGCIEEELYLIEYNQQPVITANDASICKYESVQLDFGIDPSDNILSVQWSPDLNLDDPTILTPTASPLETTEYTVEIEILSSCIGTITESVNVEVLSGSISGIDLEADVNAVCQGDEVNLIGTVEEIVFEDNFDPGVSWGIWCDISNGTGSLACGSVTGAALYFNGFGNRYATTQAIDVSNGGNVVFALKVASGVSPCDDTEFGEDIVLEYSTTGCDGPFIEIETFLEFSYPSFTNISVPIPPGAISTNTHFRWRQVANSGNNQDNWSIDDVYVGIVQNDAYEFNWYPQEYYADDGLDVNTAIPDSSGTLLLQVLDNISGCSYEDSVFVDVFPVPEFLLVEDSILCQPEELFLEAEVTSTGSFDFVWNSSDGSIVDEEIDVLQVSPQQNITYTLEVIDQNSTCSDSDDIDIIISELESIDLTSSDAGVCLEETVLFDLVIENGTSPYTTVWNSDQELTSISDLQYSSVPEESFEVDVLVTDDITGCTMSDTVEVVVSQPFEIIAPDDFETCNAVGTELLVESPDVDPNLLIWNWLPGTGLDTYDSSAVVITENSSVQYIVTASNLFDCSSADTVNVDIVFDDFDLGEDFELCDGDTYILQTGFENTNDFVWNGNPELDDPYIIITAPGNYDVFIESPLGCTFEDQLSVSYNDNPFVDLGPDQSHCVGDAISLIAETDDVEYLWNNDSENQEITVENSGYYWVEITDENGCTDQDSVFVVFHNLPDVELPDSLFACEGQDLILDAGPEGEVYLWNTGDDGQILITESTGNYEVTVTNEYGCVSVDNTFCDFGAQPEVVLPPDMHFCEGDTVIIEPLEISDDVTWYWSNGSTELQQEVYETEFLILTVENEFCQDFDGISISVHEIPNSSLPEEVTFCIDSLPDGLALGAYWEDATYYWSTGEFTPGISIDEGGIYYVDITDPYGCTGRDSINVTHYCPDVALYIPNSFTPNNDGNNDIFYCVGRNIGEFEIQVYNRWGQLVWETDDINDYWDGSYKEGDHYVIKDSYTYVVSYKYYTDEYGTLSEKIQDNGYITVVR